MYNDFKFDYKKEIKKLFKQKRFKKSFQNGQIIGLHSHNHPTKISKLNYNYQLQEYLTNKKILEKIIKKRFILVHILVVIIIKLHFIF